jgi:hypothetical protein
MRYVLCVPLFRYQILILLQQLEMKYLRLNPDLKSMIHTVKNDLTPALGM